MKIFHKMFFLVFAGMMFVSNVVAKDDGFMAQSLKYGKNRYDQTSQNPHAISGGVLLVGLGAEAAGYKKTAHVVKEMGVVGEGYALLGGSVPGTLTAMSTDCVLNVGTDCFKDNETAKTLAKYVKADTSYGQHIWRALISWAAGAWVDRTPTDEVKIKVK